MFFLLRQPLLVLALFLGLRASAALASAGNSPATKLATTNLAAALNPDGTLRAGVSGSFDAATFAMHTTADGRPVFRPLGAGDNGWQNGFGLPNGTDGAITAVACAGSDVYIGGTFTHVSDVSANRVAHWDGTAWSSLGTGTANGLSAGSSVYALAVAPTGEVYVGGSLSVFAGNTYARNIAKWNGTAWSALGTGPANGVNSDVKALAVAPSGEVYVGGFFSQAGALAASCLAKWDGTAWSTLGAGTTNGINGQYSSVSALALASNGDLYVGGHFPQAGGVAASCVAKWDGTTWSALGAGVYSAFSTNLPNVQALAVAPNGDVYAGGNFDRVGTSTSQTYGVAKWNGSTWSGLGQGVFNATGSTYVQALAVAPNGTVYVGGSFTQVYSTSTTSIPTSNVAQWDGTAWSTLGTTTTGADGLVQALAVASNGNLYMGGYFGQANGVAASYIGRWNGTTWNALGTGTGLGLNGTVNAVVVSPTGTVYVGGYFTQAGGVVANCVAQWNGTTWQSLGTGPANGTSGPVRALALAANGDLYAGGYFNQAGGINTYGIARWNGTAWSALGGGLSGGLVDAAVNALGIGPNGDVYVAGSFLYAGNVAAHHVARWDGTSWHALGSGTSLDNSASALAIAANGDVYVSGDFTQADGLTVNGVARWNGTAWNALSTGLISTNINNTAAVYALALAPNGDLYAGGIFDQAGGVVAGNIARWNGAAWNALGSNSLSGTVLSLATAGTGTVYVGGRFRINNLQAANRLVSWNSSTWTALGTGVNDGLNGLAIAAGKLYAGGDFTAVGDESKLMLHFGVFDLSTISATRPAAATATYLFPNPAWHTVAVRLPTGSAKAPLILLDALGREVRRYPAPTGSEATLDLRGLPAGVYVLRGGTASQRLVVE